ncbi:MAG: hypothetical protein RLZ83_754 [Pseudomonadota bacterium]
MNAHTSFLEIISPGAFASIQDVGRRGWRRHGVPWAGALDPHLMRLANALVGQSEYNPVIECIDAGFRVAARGGPVRVGVAGAAELEHLCGGKWRQVSPWRSLTLAQDEHLRVRRMASGRLSVWAVSGLVVSQTLGSASTYARAGLGGVDGKLLKPGVMLPIRASAPGPERLIPTLPARSRAVIRAVPGPQADHFTPQAMDLLVQSTYRVTDAADRMGVRLEGPALAHCGPREIVSDATVPGSIQVPGNGQPIVLLADAQTAGGYPKIGTVISADLALVADTRPGDTLCFVWVSVSDGEAAARAAERRTRALLDSICLVWPGGVDEHALYRDNLVSGVVNACDAEAPACTDRSSKGQPSENPAGGG